METDAVKEHYCEICGCSEKDHISIENEHNSALICKNCGTCASSTCITKPITLSTPEEESSDSSSSIGIKRNRCILYIHAECNGQDCQSCKMPIEDLGGTE